MCSQEKGKLHYSFVWGRETTGANEIGQREKGGGDNFWTTSFLKHTFSYFGYLGGLFVHVTKGGNLTHHCRGDEYLRPPIVLDSLRVNKYALEKIGENKAKCGVIAISVISCPPTHKDHKN